MKEIHRQFVESHLDKIKTHAEWLTLISFGLGTLLEDQGALIELITDEAQAMRGRGEAKTVTEGVRQIVRELGLRLVVAE